MRRNVGIIGAGGHGEAHLRMLEQFQIEGKVSLVAAADPAFERREDLKDQVSNLGASCHTDYRNMLQSHPDLDAVVVCTPIHLHKRMVADALSATNARILLEKPPVATLQELEELIALDVDRRVRVGFHMNFWPQILELKRRLLTGGFGALKKITVTAGWPRSTQYYQRAAWSGRLSLGGEPVFDGPATNALSHIIHNALFLAGKEFSSYAVPTAVRAKLTHARPIESYDTARIRALIDDAELDVLLTHALEKQVPYEVVLRFSNSEVCWQQSQPMILVDGTPITEMSFEELKNPKIPMYEDFLGEEQTFSSMICSLPDMVPFQFLLHASLLSSGGTFSIPQEEILPGDDNFFRLEGISEALECIREGASDRLAERSWLVLGAPVASADHARFLSLVGL